MINIALIDDNYSDLDTLKEYINKFLKENQNELEVETNILTFNDPLLFLNDNKYNFDLIFLDIEMPNINGISLAKKIREKDQNVGLVFITNMAQYAINGYEVSAIDYILKPLNYYDFALKFNKIIKYINRNIASYIFLKNGENNIVKVNVNEIIFVEIFSHYLIYHLENKDIKVRGTISDAETKLANSYFSRISKSFLVNLKHVINVKLDKVMLTGNVELIISRLRKKEFLDAFYNYLGGGLK